ncbi:MAG: hypothetical protein ABIF11_03260 [Nitrospirota bacterium]
MATEKNSLDTRVLLEALVGLKNGDFSVRLREEVIFYEYSNLGR